MTSKRLEGLTSSSVSGVFGRRCLDTSAAVDEFRGQPGMAAEQWLKQFEYTRRTGRWHDINTMAVIFNMMKGPARTWHLSHNENAEDYEVWKRRLQENFVPRRRQGALIDGLQRCVRKPGGDLQEHARNTAALAVQLNMG